MDLKDLKTNWAELKEGSAIYLCGPMRGLPRHGFDEFDRVAASIRRQRPDIRVYSPHEHALAHGFDPDSDNVGFNIKHALAWDMQRVLDSDAVIVITTGFEWRNSVGVDVELRLAAAAGIDCYAYAYETLVVDFDEHDSEDVWEAMKIREAYPIPGGGGSRSGRLLAEICRVYLDSQRVVEITTKGAKNP